MGKYKRVILKISGEALAGPDKFGIHMPTVAAVVKQLAVVHAGGVQVGVVLGGGNFWRGRQGTDMSRTAADHMGMLATVINSLALQDALEKEGVPTRVQTAIAINDVAEPYIVKRAIRHFEKGRVVIFSCGTGNPFFSTDTGAALRAAETGADALLMAKNIDAVYDSDPRKNPNAKKFETIAYMDVINRGLSLMDATSITMCMENKIPIIAFGLAEKDGIIKAANGERIGTLIR
ncbi:MAG: UMP kinase [Clostridiales bacterium]|jgi:uridylate kinase|nr:UMP kinase [Clostridiales bacterium]